jgi:hypothetical protein
MQAVQEPSASAHWPDTEVQLQASPVFRLHLLDFGRLVYASSAHDTQNRTALEF